ncbi:MAG: type II secretion system protein [Ilumatobacteraceae bacterium]
MIDAIRRLRSRRRSTNRDDAGFTLLEISAAMVLLGLGGLIVMGGLFTVVHASSINNDQARVEAVLSSAADRLTSWTYVPCPPASGAGSYLDVVQPAASTVGWDPSTVSITSITYFDPTAPASNPWSTSNNASGGCNPNIAATSPRSLQRVVLHVSTPSGSYTRDLEVVKNNVIPASKDAAT